MRLSRCSVRAPSRSMIAIISSCRFSLYPTPNVSVLRTAHLVRRTEQRLVRCACLCLHPICRLINSVEISSPSQICKLSCWSEHSGGRCLLGCYTWKSRPCVSASTYSQHTQSGPTNRQPCPRRSDSIGGIAPGHCVRSCLVLFVRGSG